MFHLRVHLACSGFQSGHLVLLLPSTAARTAPCAQAGESVSARLVETQIQELLPREVQKKIGPHSIGGVSHQMWPEALKTV